MRSSRPRSALAYLLARGLISFDPNDTATTVGGSAAHEAFVNKPAAPAADPAPAAAPAAPTPAPSSGTPAPAGGGASGAAPSDKAATLKDATKAWLGADKSKPGAPAPAAGGAAPAAAAVKGAEAAGAAAAAAATAAGASPAEAQKAGVQAADDFLEGIGTDGQPFKIPVGVKVPVKINGKIEMRAIGDVRKSFMLEGDYTRSKQRLSEAERSMAAERARIDAQNAQLAADRKEYEEAIVDPEKWEQYQQHMAMLNSNPIYRAKWERGRQADLDSAELEAFRGTESEAVTRSTVENIVQTISTLSAEYPGADPELVRQQYAQALSTGQAQLSEASLRSFFEAEKSPGHADGSERSREGLFSEVYVPLMNVDTPFKNQLEKLKTRRSPVESGSSASSSPLVVARRTRARTSRCRAFEQGSVRPGRRAGGAYVRPHGARRPRHGSHEDEGRVLSPGSRRDDVGPPAGARPRSQSPVLLQRRWQAGDPGQRRGGAATQSLTIDYGVARRRRGCRHVYEGDMLAFYQTNGTLIGRKITGRDREP
jgi:hypothetical protein